MKNIRKVNDLNCFIMKEHRACVYWRWSTFGRGYGFVELRFDDMYSCIVPLCKLKALDDNSSLNIWVCNFPTQVFFIDDKVIRIHGTWKTICQYKFQYIMQIISIKWKYNCWSSMCQSSCRNWPSQWRKPTCYHQNTCFVMMFISYSIIKSKRINSEKF